jgi:hypothetical protein
MIKAEWERTQRAVPGFGRTTVIVLVIRGHRAYITATLEQIVPVF